MLNVVFTIEFIDWRYSQCIFDPSSELEPLVQLECEARNSE
jgi:hypothetical protein